MPLPIELKRKLETTDSIDDLTQDEQMMLVAEEGKSRIIDGIATDMEDCLDQLEDEGISAGFNRSDVRWAIERF